MTTSNSPKTYPPRLYEEGKCPLQYRSMNHNCHLASLQMVEESVGLDAWESIKETAVGVIPRLKELDYIWSAQVVHHILTNQLVVENSHEMWSLIEDQPLRFSLHEYGEITGLNCEPFNIHDKVEVDHKPFWEEMGVSPSHGPMLSELRLLFPHIRNWSFEKRRMIDLLCVLSVGILGISRGSRIPLDEANTYEPKTWKFTDCYKRAFNGNYSADFTNNKKWLTDVDTLYLCHLINGDHWVALEVDLLKQTIQVYDSIPTVVPDMKDLQEECRPFTKMIPLLLNEMVPAKHRKKSSQQFKLSRNKKVPKNDEPGDCGVYTLKYIECRAMGCGFEGLSDKIIPALRIKLAAEIFDEVSEM